MSYSEPTYTYSAGPPMGAPASTTLTAPYHPSPTPTKSQRFLNFIRTKGRAAGVKSGKFALRTTKAGVRGASLKALGLTPSEYAELRRLRDLKRRRELTGDEGYIEEMKRLKVLERRYMGGLRARQTRKVAGRFVPYALRRNPPPKRLRS